MPSTPLKNPQFKIYILLVALILVWGLSWPVNKLGLAYMPPLWFAASRILIGMVSMLLIVTALGKLVWLQKQDLKLILVIGLLQIALFMVLLNIGLYYVAAGRSAILVYTTPIWVVPISVFFLKETPSPLKWIGFILGLVGILVLFNPWGIDWSNHTVLFGNGVLLVAALCWSIAILCARHMQWSRTPLELIFWQLLLGAIPVTLLAYLLQPHPDIIWNTPLILSLLYGGIAATAFAYWGTVTISKELPAITTSLSLLLIPPCGVIFSALLLHEAITLSIMLSMGFILAGVICVIFSK